MLSELLVLRTAFPKAFRGIRWVAALLFCMLLLIFGLGLHRGARLIPRTTRASWPHERKGGPVMLARCCCTVVALLLAGCSGGRSDSEAESESPTKK